MKEGGGRNTHPLASFKRKNEEEEEEGRRRRRNWSYKNLRRKFTFEPAAEEEEVEEEVEGHLLKMARLTLHRSVTALFHYFSTFSVSSLTL